jgi:hypothetical protein
MNRSLQIRAGLTVVILLFSLYGLLPTFKALSISSDEREAAQGDPEKLAEIADIDAAAIRRGLDLKRLKTRCCGSRRSSTTGSTSSVSPNRRSPRSGRAGSW